MRMLSKTTLVLLLVGFMFMCVPFAAHAAGLVPCGDQQDAAGHVTNPCNICNLFDLTKNIIDFVMFRLVPAVGTLMFLIAGFQIMVSRGGGDYGKAKTLMTNTVIGVVIIFAAWMITNFILLSLARKNGADVATWFNITCQEAPSIGTTGGGTGTGTKSPPPSLNDGVHLSDSAARAQLKPGIIVKPGASLEGIRQSSIDEANRLKDECSCTVTINEGTGGTHADGVYSHSNGFKLDFQSKNASGQPNTTTQYILSHPEEFQYSRVRSDGALVYVRASNPNVEYNREDLGTSNEHWDVLIKS